MSDTNTNGKNKIKVSLDPQFHLKICVHLGSRFQSLLYFIIKFGKFGPPYLGKTTAAARAALSIPTSARWVFSCFLNPPNSDRDYMIFNVRT